MLNFTSRLARPTTLSGRGFHSYTGGKVFSM